MRATLITAIIFAGFFLGCSRAEKNSEIENKKFTGSLLDRSLFELMAAKGDGPKRWSFKDFDTIWKIEITWRQRNYSLRRMGKNWWVEVRDSNGEYWGKELSLSFLAPLSSELKKFQLASEPTERSRGKEVELSFFGEDGSYYFSLLSPAIRGEERGQWLVYSGGRLFIRRSEKLSRALEGFIRQIRRVRRRGGWLHLPLNSRDFPPELLLKVASYLKDRRLNLRRCFRKRRFPASIGPLKMFLRFSPNGELIERKIETSAHLKHRVVWCPWWHVKFWKISPPPGREVRYRLFIPPAGP